MSVTLINSFVVPVGREQDFIQSWLDTRGHFVNAPGFIEAKLHRNTGANDKTFNFVNIALWESIDDYHNVFKNFTPAGRRIDGTRAHPGLFGVIEILSAGQDLEG